MSIKERTKQILSLIKKIDKYKKLSSREYNIISKLVAVLMESPKSVREKFYQDVLVLVNDAANKIKKNLKQDEEMDQLEETLGLKDKIYN